MAKPLGFAGLHMGVAFAVGDLMTGSPWVGGARARVEPAWNARGVPSPRKVRKRIEARRALPRNLIGA